MKKYMKKYDYRLLQDETVFASHIDHDCMVVQSRPFMLLVICKECEDDHVATIIVTDNETGYGRK